MFFLTKLGESRRIKQLLMLYKDGLASGTSEAQARLAVLCELRLRSGRLGDQIDGLDDQTKEDEIEALFSPLKVRTYDVCSLVAFIVGWENPNRYNYMPTVQQIRSGKHARADLERRVAAIGSQVLS